MDPLELPRDKDDVLKPLSLPGYHKEQQLGQHGEWVLIAVLPRKAGEREALAVLDYADRTFLQRYQGVKELLRLAYRNSAVRAGGGWALNLKTGATVPVPPGKPVKLSERP